MIQWEMFNDLLVGKWKWIIYVIKTYLFHDSYFVYVAEAIIALMEKA